MVRQVRPLHQEVVRRQEKRGAGRVVTPGGRVLQADALALKCSSFSLTLFLPFHLSQDFVDKVSLGYELLPLIRIHFLPSGSFGLDSRVLVKLPTTLFTHYHFL